MLLLKTLLLGEVCTLLLQMEPLRGRRHLPAQMDWLSAWRVRRRRDAERGTAACGARAGGRRVARADQHPGPGCAGTERLVALIASEQLGHR